MPTIYYIRHGETDWNVEGRLQGRHDVPLNAKGRGQAIHCGGVLRDLFAREGVIRTDLDYVTSPLGRAAETMRLVRAGLDLPGEGARVDPQLSEISFGDWEGFTIAQLRSRDPQRVAMREHDKWRFVAPGGESYEAVAARMGAWYRTLTKDAVVTAHGGTARGLMAHLGLAHPAAAPLIDIAQGVVYVFAAGTLTRYA
ncbi:MAG: histidine phosphatase family protein [Pseudolabrys sp.]|nr:histidine phosphatase family protein [Pseudolabrys sp.]